MNVYLFVVRLKARIKIDIIAAVVVANINLQVINTVHPTNLPAVTVNTNLHLAMTDINLHLHHLNIAMTRRDHVMIAVQNVTVRNQSKCFNCGALVRQRDY